MAIRRHITLRVLAHTIAAFMATTAAVVASAPTAQAGVACDGLLAEICGQFGVQTHADSPSYRGWGYVFTGDVGAAPAWAWNGNSWRATSRRSLDKVYLWPYRSGWVWTWSAGTGWLAMRSNTTVVGA